VLFEKEAAIGIDHMRQLGKETALKQTKPQTVIIDRAERLTIPAQNSFLKLLEEPPANISFILGVKHRNSLLPTIVSRCALVKTGCLIQMAENKQTLQTAKLFLTTISRGITNTIDYKNKIKKELRDEKKAQQFFEVWISVLRDSILLKLGSEGVIFNSLASDVENTFSRVPLARIRDTIELGNKYYGWVQENRVGKDKIAASFLNLAAHLCTQKNN